MSTEALVNLSNVFTKYVIVMQTFNREKKFGKNLLQDTIDSLIKSGLWKSSVKFHLVIHDSTNGENPALNGLENLENTTIVRDCSIGGQLGNAYTSLKYAQENFISEYVISVEDDIIFCKNWIDNIDDWITKNIKEDDILFSFFTPYNHTKLLYDINIEVWDGYKNEDFYGNQCICFRHSQLNNICKIFKEKLDIGKIDGSDIILHEWLEKYNKKQTIKASCPCLVQHRNLFSTVTHGSVVLSSSFLGENIDPGFRV